MLNIIFNIILNKRTSAHSNIEYNIVPMVDNPQLWSHGNPTCDILAIFNSGAIATLEVPICPRGAITAIFNSGAITTLGSLLQAAAPNVRT